MQNESVIRKDAKKQLGYFDTLNKMKQGAETRIKAIADLATAENRGMTYAEAKEIVAMRFRIQKIAKLLGPQPSKRERPMLTVGSIYDMGWKHRDGSGDGYATLLIEKIKKSGQIRGLTVAAMPMMFLGACIEMRNFKFRVISYSYKDGTVGLRPILPGETELIPWERSEVPEIICKDSPASKPLGPDGLTDAQRRRREQKSNRIASLIRRRSANARLASIQKSVADAPAGSLGASVRGSMQ